MASSRTRGAIRRRWRTWLVVLLPLTVVLWTVLGLYPLFYPLGFFLKLDYPPGLYPKPSVSPGTLALEGPTLFIADLHIAREEDSLRLSSLAQFIDLYHVRSLVIVGDLFDEPWYARRILGSSTGEEVAQVILRILGLNGSVVHLYFLIGNHDPEDFNLNSEGESAFRTLGKSARFSIDGVSVVALHGDEAFGAAHVFLFSHLTGRPYLEAWWKDVMRLDGAEWVIIGHSHMPGIDPSRRVANTGGWADLFGFGPPGGMGILVADGEVSLLKVKG